MKVKFLIRDDYHEIVESSMTLLYSCTDLDLYKALVSYGNVSSVIAESALAVLGRHGWYHKCSLLLCSAENLT